MISKSKLQRLANREKIGLGTLEKDYVLNEVLEGLSLVPQLNELFVFKGGTALRKAYFPDWRYSEDLDFTAKRNMNQEELSHFLDRWYKEIEEASQVRLFTKMLYKPNGYARIRSQFFGPLNHPGLIFFDISFDEQLCLEPECRRVLVDPFQSKNRKILVYSLEEILAEKLRSLLERGKARDYYDVWRLLKEKSTMFDNEILKKVFYKKITHKNIQFNGLDSFVLKDREIIGRYWMNELGHQINQLPSFDEVLNELPGMLANIF